MKDDASTWKCIPYSINIETVQGCNRRCEFCGTMGMEKAFHFLGMNTLMHTLNLIRGANYTPRIRLAAHGEPTLHKDICTIVRAIRKALPKSPISLFTNGTVIEKKPQLVSDLFSAGLNNLVVDEYSDHRVGAFIRANEICQRYTIVEQGAGTSLLTVDVKAKRICIVPPIDGDKNTMNRQLCNQCGAALPPLEKPLNGKKCTVIFREMTVRWDGNIAICCNDFRGYYPVTNIMNHSTLYDAWFHPRFESARKYLFRGDRHFFPCNVCDVLGNRVGLLPKMNSKNRTYPEPNDNDKALVNKLMQPLAKIEKRPWEE